MVGGFDVHRQPVKFDYTDDGVSALRSDSSGTGETAGPRLTEPLRSAAIAWNAELGTIRC